MKLSRHGVLRIRGQRIGGRVPLRISQNWGISKDVSAFDSTREHRVNQTGVVQIGVDTGAGELREIRRELDAIGCGVDKFCSRNVAEALDSRGLVCAQFGFKKIRDCYGRDDQNDSDYNQKLDEGKSSVGEVRVFRHLRSFQLAHDENSCLVRARNDSESLVPNKMGEEGFAFLPHAGCFQVLL